MLDINTLRNQVSNTAHEKKHKSLTINTYISDEHFDLVTHTSLCDKTDF